jgi:hypothetical protein
VLAEELKPKTRKHEEDVCHIWRWKIYMCSGKPVSGRHFKTYCGKFKDKTLDEARALGWRGDNHPGCTRRLCAVCGELAKYPERHGKADS